MPSLDTDDQLSSVSSTKQERVDARREAQESAEDGDKVSVLPSQIVTRKRLAIQRALGERRGGGTQED